MRNYGRECALAYIMEGDSITEAVTKATKLMYRRCYDDAKGYIKHVGGERDRAEAVTSLVDTQTTLLNDATATGDRAFFHHSKYYDDHGLFEVADLIARLEIPAQEKQVLGLIALGYGTKEIAEQVGLKRTTLSMRLPKIMERIREQCRTAISSL